MQNNKINIEAEGGELLLRNSNNDIIIIPVNKANWVKQKLSEGCHNCIDSLVESLPSMEDYAEDGTIIPAKTTRQLWEEETGLDWKVAKEEGISDGSYDSNIKLQQYLKNKNYSKYDMSKIAPRNGSHKYQDDKGNSWEESYKMGWSEQDGKYFVHPTIFQNKDNTWDLENKDPLNEAITRNEAIEFDNKYDAAIFSANTYKKYSPSLKNYFTPYNK